MVKKIKDKILAKLSEHLIDERYEKLLPASNNARLNCWACGDYDDTAEKCYGCQKCNLWTLKKIFLHNRRYLRNLDINQLNKIGLTH